jgi:hypothetical protein
VPQADAVVGKRGKAYFENPNPLSNGLKPANVASINLYAQLLHWLARLLDA